MNLIHATGRLLRSAPVLVKSVPSVRGAIYLDKDWAPGNYPKTEEERLAAAKKYNLLPEEYQPYDPEKWEMALGDYPQLPNLHQSDRDFDYPWDYHWHRHNYGEPWHAYQQRYGWFSPEMNQGTDWVPTRQIVWLYVVTLFLIYKYVEFIQTYDRVVPFKPVHIVQPGVVHYHFPNSKIEMYEEGHHHH